MTDPMQSLVHKICARLRELLAQPNENDRHRIFQLRECTASLQNMPWYPRVPQLTPEDLELLHWLRLELSHELGPTDIISDADLVYLALRELELALRSADREDEILRLRFHLTSKEHRA